jgi:tripeptidyl-peptidase-1
MRSVYIAAILLNAVSAVSTNGWSKLQRASGDEMIKITLPIKQSNLQLVEKLFWEVSNPNSTLFGKYLSFDEIGELIRNEHATVSTVDYLKAIGVRSEHLTINPHGTFISAKLPVNMANKVFDADFHVYSHPLAAHKVIKTESASLPEELEAHVTHVPHVSYFPHVQKKVKFTPQLGVADNTLAAAASSSNYVTPQLLSQYYGIDNTVVSNGATQSLFEALGQQFDNDDLNTFQSQFGLYENNITDIVGNDIPSACFESTGADNCGEANLDVQYIMAIAQMAETTYWNIDNSASDPFLDWVEALSYYSNPPQVHSISYGGGEDSSNNDMTVFNTEIQKLGLQGITVIVSSGDDGAAGNAARSDTSYCGYSASFPASSPYVTAVGATQGPESGSTEVVCSSATGGVITSGGGFSSIFSQPSYQSAHVSAYFDNVNTQPVSGYNANGRGYPDVAILGYNYVLAIGGQFTLESGTSASAPVFAGMITLINDARLSAGKSPLGFLNQALYSLDSSVWNDIVSGDNTCTAGECCSQGFHASQGWDPVTGLGSPHFLKLKEALIAL